MKRVAVLDYGSGNVHSAVKALAAAGAEATLTRDAATVAHADALLVPGVGAFAAVMEQLRAIGGDDMIRARVEAERPVLGICVGQQIMFEAGTEHGVHTRGLGLLPGVVAQLETAPLPHMGWNTVHAADGSSLFRGIEEERFYFVHSYGTTLTSYRTARGATSAAAADAHLLTTARHGDAEFLAAVEHGPLSVTQFHPEKSGEAGIQLLRNWLFGSHRS